MLAITWKVERGGVEAVFEGVGEAKREDEEWTPALVGVGLDQGFAPDIVAPHGLGRGSAHTAPGSVSGGH